MQWRPSHERLVWLVGCHDACSVCCLEPDVCDFACVCGWVHALCRDDVFAGQVMGDLFVGDEADVEAFITKYLGGPAPNR